MTPEVEEREVDPPGKGEVDGWAQLQLELAEAQRAAYLACRDFVAEDDANWP